MNSKINKALKKYSEKNFDESLNICKEIIENNENDIDALNLIGVILIEKGKLLEAKKYFEEVIKIDQNFFISYYNIGNIYNILGNYKYSVENYKIAIKLNPKFLKAKINLANILQKSKNYDEAKKSYEDILKIDPKNSIVHNNLGILFRELKIYNKAKKHCEKAIALDFKFSEPYNVLGLISLDFGNKRESIKYFKKAIKYNPSNLNYIYNLSKVNYYEVKPDHKKLINKISKDNYSSLENKAFANFLLAKEECIKGNYDKEYKYLIKGHNFYFEANSKIFQDSLRYLNLLPKKIKNINFHQLIKDNKFKDNLNPIFIVGLPRTGSTLIEKIIVSSFNIQVGEETGIIHNIIQNELTDVKNINYKKIINIRDKVIKEYESYGLINKNSNFMFTDKSLENFFYIGLIKIIFPNAKIINCTRDPLSSIISIIRNNLSELAWAHKNEYICEYFNMYFEYIHNWNKMFPRVIHTINYENLVNKSEVEVKKLLKYCELPWNNNVFKFYKRKNIISKTNSNQQIRKPLNKDSLNKYDKYKNFFISDLKKKYIWL